MSGCEHFPDCDREGTYLAVNGTDSGRFCYSHYPKPLWGWTITYIGKGQFDSRRRHDVR
jgi:hypothetical protein